MNQNGIITGYSILFKVKGSPLAWQERRVGGNTLTLHVANLDFYTMYEFKIAAETVIGRGPYSNSTYIRTHADGKKLY